MKEKLLTFLKGISGVKLGVRVVYAIFHEFTSLPALTRCLFALIFNPQGCILVRGWIFTKKGKVIHNNWGDDINVSFFSEATGKKVLVCPNSFLSRFVGLKSFSLIGSIIQFAPQRNTIVWGSGLINDRRGFRLPSKKCKILAVRGPLTREWLLEQGIDCPPIFGDPALLLPRFYSPQKLPRKRVGLIPHHADIENKNPHLVRLKNSSNVRLIKVQGYEDWRGFIDEICASDFVISASLHGLIVAEAYGVPALWVEFSEHIEGWDFKFRDFYLSIGKPDTKSVAIDETTQIEGLIAKCKEWQPGTINVDELLLSCPLELKPVS